MGLLEILIGTFVVILVLVIFAQPISILNDEAADTLENAGSTDKYGTDPEGNTVLVGASSGLATFTQALLWLIPIMIVVGFIIWIIRYGRGGVYDVE